jgi:steroid delta-isomerase-like uncharacterized protein
MAATEKPMTMTKIRSVADSMVQAWNDHDIEAMLEHLTDDVVWAEPTLEEPIRGKAAVAAHVKDTLGAFPDLMVLEEDFHLFADTDDASAVTTWTLKATNTGASKETGIPATGKEITLSGTNLFKFRGDLIKEYVLVYDSLHLLQQLGALPKSDGLGFKALVMADIMAGKAAEQAGALVGRARQAMKR